MWIEIVKIDQRLLLKNRSIQFLEILRIVFIKPKKI